MCVCVCVYIPRERDRDGAGEKKGSTSHAVMVPSCLHKAQDISKFTCSLKSAL